MERVLGGTSSEVILSFLRSGELNQVRYALKKLTKIVDQEWHLISRNVDEM
jgi:hypothetical protein